MISRSTRLSVDVKDQDLQRGLNLVPNSLDPLRMKEAFEKPCSVLTLLKRGGDSTRCKHGNTTMGGRAATIRPKQTRKQVPKDQVLTSSTRRLGGIPKIVATYTSFLKAHHTVVPALPGVIFKEAPNVGGKNGPQLARTFPRIAHGRIKDTEAPRFPAASSHSTWFSSMVMVVQNCSSRDALELECEKGPPTNAKSMGQQTETVKPLQAKSPSGHQGEAKRYG